MILGAAIGANNLAVALSLGALGQAPRRWRIAGVFGFFEFTVPLIGLLIGRELADAAADTGRWIGAALLAGLALWTIWSASDPSVGERAARRVASWGGLVALSLSLSLDNLVVGFALGLGTAGPLLVAAAIAGFSVSFTLIGLQIGAHGRRHWEGVTELTAGLALLAIAALVALGWLA